MMNTQLSPKEWQLLSAYLDGQLAEREHTQVERQLSARPALRTALDEMRVNRAVIRRLAVRKVPHNFILTREMAAAARHSWYTGIVPVLRFSSVISAAFLILTLLAGPLLRSPAAVPMALPDDAMRAAGAEEAPLAPEAALQAEPATEPGAAEDGGMLWWGGPIYMPEATGMGGMGGGDGMINGKGGGGVDLIDPYNSGGLPNVYHPPADMYGGGMAEAVPPAASSEPQPEEAPAPQSTDFENGPILGLAGEEQQGQMVPQAIAAPAQEERGTVGDAAAEQSAPNFLAVQVGLVLLALTTGLAAVWLHRKAAG